MKVWLIRHGMTRLGEEGRYQGSLDEGLSEKGKTALRSGDLRPEKVYVSPARRARETAALLFPDSVQIPVPELREMDFGAFDGRGWWEMENDAQYRAWVAGNCRGRCPGGEDRDDFTERVCKAVLSILEEERAAGCAEVVFVAHGGTQMAALSRWGSPARDYYRWQSQCGCGWLLNWEEREQILSVQREISFLA